MKEEPQMIKISAPTKELGEKAVKTLEEFAAIFGEKIQVAKVEEKEDNV